MTLREEYEKCDPLITLIIRLECGELRTVGDSLVLRSAIQLHIMEL